MYINNKKTNDLLIISLVMLFSITACGDDPLSNEPEAEIINLLVANEGNWSDGNGSITSYNPETGQVIQEKFQQVNARPLAGIIQSTVWSGDRLFIAANNRDKIEVANEETLESIATIHLDESPALTPSAFAFLNEQKGYVSGLYSNSVFAVDLENYTVDGNQIEVGSNPVDLLVAGSRLYVANSGFGNDNTVTVIDTNTDEVITTVTTGAGPIRLKADSEGRIWVVCSGLKAYDENWQRDPDHDIPGQIDILDISDHQITATIKTGGFPKSIALGEERGQAWVVNEEAVQLIDMNRYEVLDGAFIARSFNGIGLSTAEERLYLAQSRGYTQSGQAMIYNLEGAAVDSFQAGIAPMDFHFQVIEN